MNRQWILLGLVAVLAVAKFGLLPILQSLDEKNEQLLRLEERLQKSYHLIAEVEHLEEQTKTLDKGLNSLKGRFEIVSSAENARLGFQQKLEEKARNTGVDLESLEWTRNTEGVPSMSQVNLKVKSKLKELMKFHSDIANLGFGVTTAEMQLNVNRQLLSRGRLGTISGQLSFRIYYLVENE